MAFFTEHSMHANLGPHWPSATLMTEFTQHCDTAGLSMSTCPAISCWALQKAPRMYSLGGGKVSSRSRPKFQDCHFYFPFLSVSPLPPSHFQTHLTFSSVPLLFPSVALSVISLCLSVSPSLSSLVFSSLGTLPTPPSSPVKFAKHFLILSISISSFSPRLLGWEECIVCFGTPFVTLLIYF